MTTRPPSKARSVVAGLAGVVAVVAIVAGLVGFWVRNTVYDSAAIARLTYQELEQPEVADALSAYVTDQLFTALDVERRVNELVPDQLESLAGALLGGAQSRIEDRLSERIQSDEFRAIVAVAVGRAHAAAVDLVRGEGLVDGVTVDDGDVTLNLLPLMARAITGIQELGLLTDLDVPEMDRSGDPDEQRAQLEEAIGRDLPEGFGEVVVYSSDRLAEAGATLESIQRIVVTIDRALWVLLIGGVALAVVAGWLAGRRPRAIAWMSGAVLVGLVVVRVLARVAVQRIPDVIERPGAKVAVGDTLRELQDSLTSSTVAFVILSLVILVSAVIVNRRSGRSAEVAAAA